MEKERRKVEGEYYILLPLTIHAIMFSGQEHTHTHTHTHTHKHTHTHTGKLHFSIKDYLYLFKGRERNYIY